MVHRNIPMDIIETKILTRLPAKSIGRFMCVSKQWKSFLSSQDFRLNHLHHLTAVDPRSHQKLLLVDPLVGSFRTLDCGTTPTDLSIHLPTPFGSNDHDMHVVASFHGLVCVVMSDTKQLMLWNPLTRAYRMLSISNLYLHTFKHVVWDAFGLYSDSSNDYKLLHLVRDEKGPRLYIYSRRLDSWVRKFLSFNCAGYLGCCWAYHWSPSTFLGQTLYFTVVSRNVSPEHCCIAAFDVESESFREIQFPSQVLGFRGYNMTLVVMNGCVHLCAPPYPINNTQFYTPWVDVDVWRMVGDGDGWIKVAAYSCDNSIPFTLTPYCIVRHGKWDVSWRFNKAFCKASGTTSSSYHLARAIYIETLMSPDP